MFAGDWLRVGGFFRGLVMVQPPLLHLVHVGGLGVFQGLGWGLARFMRTGGLCIVRCSLGCSTGGASVAILLEFGLWSLMGWQSIRAIRSSRLYPFFNTWRSFHATSFRQSS